MMMKKIWFILVVTACVLAAVTPVAAQTVHPPFTTAFAVQNQSETEDAHVTVEWYNEEGTKVYTSPEQTIAPGQLGNYLAGTGLSSSWAGSVVILSDQPVAAISNTTDDFGSPTFWGANEGSNGTDVATEVYLPFALRNRGGRTSTLGVQNAGSEAANVYINFIGHSSSPVNYTVVKNLNPGASTILELGNEVTPLGDAWMGSVTITSTQKVAASAMDIGPQIVYNYSGVAAPATDLVLPFVAGARSGQDTAHALLNPATNGVAASVTITYTGSGPAGNVVVVKTATIGSGDLWNQLHSAHTGSGFLGSAVIHSNVPVLGIVNHTYGSFGDSGRKMAYSMIDKELATPNISLPYILRARSNKDQGIIIQNASDTNTTVSVTFTPAAGSGNGVAHTVTRSVSAGQFYNFATSFAEWNTITDGAYGSMSVSTSPAVDVVAIVNTWNSVVSTGVDSLGSYIGTNQ